MNYRCVTHIHIAIVSLTHIYIVSVNYRCVTHIHIAIVSLTHIYIVSVRLTYNGML